MSGLETIVPDYANDFYQTPKLDLEVVEARPEPPLRLKLPNGTYAEHRERGGAAAVLTDARFRCFYVRVELVYVHAGRDAEVELRGLVEGVRVEYVQYRETEVALDFGVFGEE